MRNFLLGIKLNMLIIIAVSIIAGVASEVLLNSKWYAFWIVVLPLIGLYMWQEYTKMNELNKKLQNKHKNKYR